VRLVKEGHWEWTERLNISGAVMIVALTEAHELVMVEQYRIPLHARVIELPAGLAGDEAATADEPLATAASRELVEETGFEAERLEYLIDGPTSAGMTSETYSMFLARNVRRVGPGGGDAHEDIQVHVVPLERVEQWLADRRREGVLVDPRVYLGLYFARHGR
jgi:ADP-ribose pyrophosphatase